VELKEFTSELLHIRFKKADFEQARKPVEWAVTDLVKAGFCLFQKHGLEVYNDTMLNY
jgi:hypothetical protein